MPVVWNDELKERVKGLWSTNTATQIAVLLNSEGYTTTRASVIGTIHRMGLTAQNKTVDHPLANAKGRSQPRAPKQKTISRIFDLFTAPLPHRESFFGPENVHGVEPLESHHCRFILNDDMAAPIYCGAPMVPYSSFSWCAHHHEICRGIGTAGERAAA